MKDFLNTILMNEAGAEGAAGGGAAASETGVGAPPEVPTAETGQEGAAKAPVTTDLGEPEGEKETPAGGTGEVFEPTGDPALDYVLSYVAENGVAYDSPAFQAALKGDFALLEVELLKAGAPGHDRVLDLAKRSYEAAASQAKERAEATAKSLVEIAGGEENWEQVVNWARENATPDERTEINSLLAKGGLAARIAGSYLVNAYTAASGTTHEGKAAASPAAAAAAPAPAQSAGPITRAEFAEAASALHARYGDAYNKTPEYQALAKRLRR